MSEYSLITQFPTGPAHESATERLDRFNAWAKEKQATKSFDEDDLTLLYIEAVPLVEAARLEAANKQSQTN